jgi:hypothetical protein
MNIRHPLALAALSVAVIGSTSLSHAAPVSGQGTWETTLQGRDLDGNLSTFEAYYDTAQNITWLADANYAMTTGADADGRMNWTTANLWAAGLNPYGSGITGWRLPTTIDADGPDADALGNDGCNHTPTYYQGLDCGSNISVHSEMSHMYYVTLGDKAQLSTTGTLNQPGWGLTNTGPFSNVQTGIYWSATEYAPDTSVALNFYFSTGRQDASFKTSDGLYAWAVHSGDAGASTVPVPAAVWLFGSGLIGLLGMSRKRQR